jgi:hypothetical protein
MIKFQASKAPMEVLPVDGHPRQFRIQNNPDACGKEWDDQYVSFSGYCGDYPPSIFAAAPELLEAMEAISRHYENPNINHIDFRIEAKILADAAIAKARGEA